MYLSLPYLYVIFFDANTFFYWNNNVVNYKYNILFKFSWATIILQLVNYGGQLSRTFLTRYNFKS